jgi:orotidine-5'-phosphate decarboxylase
MTAELWLALDVSDTQSAVRYTKELKDYVDVFKIGLELFTAEGPAVVNKIKECGGRVFLDLKFNDIPNTVAGAVRNVTRLGADFIDIHACGGPDMMKAAVEAAKEEAERCGLKKAPKILAITVLTSIDNSTLSRLGLVSDARHLVQDWAQLAQECGLDGVVNSIHEVTKVKDVCGPDFLTVTPGIRLGSTSDSDDQQRVGTPKQAALLGASAIVVGRPILTAKDPLAAAAAIKGALLQVNKEL